VANDVAETQRRPAVSGRDDICAAYQDEDRAGAYIHSRYEDDPFGKATHEHQVRRLRRILHGLRAARVLEVATGPGRVTVHLPRVEAGIGVEQSPAMIRIARERLRRYGRDDWSVQQGDAFDLPFRNHEFDTALSFKLLRHFARDDRHQLLTNMRSAVRCGGHVIFDVANASAYRWLHAKWGIEQGWIDDFWFTEREIRAELRDFGFGKVTLYPVQPMIAAQYYCWSRLWRISRPAALGVGRLLEWCPWGQPLEWIAVCQCA
jgi:SAM-dependent methyltransferase